MPFAHSRNRVIFARVCTTRWYVIVWCLVSKTAERERSCCKKKSSRSAGRSIFVKVVKPHPSKWSQWPRSPKKSSRSTAPRKRKSKAGLQDARSPRRVIVNIVVEHTNEAALPVLPAVKHAQNVESRITSPAFASKERIESHKEVGDTPITMRDIKRLRSINHNSFINARGNQCSPDNVSCEDRDRDENQRRKTSQISNRYRSNMQQCHKILRDYWHKVRKSSHANDTNAENG